LLLILWAIEGEVAVVAAAAAAATAEVNSSKLIHSSQYWLVKGDEDSWGKRDFYTKK